MSNDELQVNSPEIVDQVRTAFEHYEGALKVHDVALLNEFFLDSPHVVRYGIAEHSYGIEALREYRRNAAPLPPGRKLRNTTITTFGDSTASVCTEFLRSDSRFIGRQSQTWVRTSQGWKIVSAHVSEVDQAVLQGK